MEHFALQFSIGLLVMVGPMLGFAWVICNATIQREWQELHDLNGWELPKDGQ
jgi:hypothetical protein